MNNRQWLCLMPHRYGWGDNQGRDIGALANGLRQIGERADFFVLDERTNIKDPEVQLAGPRQLSDPAWWQARGQGVFLTTFGTSLMQPFYRAARHAGWKVWTRMDCDGVPGPDGGAAKYIMGRVVESVDSNRRKHRDFSGTFPGLLEGFVRGCAGVALASLVRKRLRDSYHLVDRFLVETPLAKKSFQTYLRKNCPQVSTERLVLIPPAISETFNFARDRKKTATILAVGQWWRMQKNSRLLSQAIHETISANESIRWIVAGDGARLVESRIKSKQPRILGRINFYDHLSPSELALHYATSQIIFYSSLQEGFPNTLSEALCSGSTFIAPEGIQAFDHCARMGWGNTYSRGEAADALLAEIKRWSTTRVEVYAKRATDAQNVFYRRHVAQLLLGIRSGVQNDSTHLPSQYFAGAPTIN